ncbi:hypothetical protein J7481_22880 [Labrenzia sp. R4_2]|uniref:hypothetical protein n=1 Tax=Labrenzia sp. R4_2 TaxID=2821107 RepID=UPI001ADAFAB1|nr:hypothetical protein [Labrenzia sp. R4_2]MBO9422374.1 hypothetical protein [Labrenzia sp. R4_2]
MRATLIAFLLLFFGNFAALSQEKGISICKQLPWISGEPKVQVKYGDYVSTLLTENGKYGSSVKKVKSETYQKKLGKSDKFCDENRQILTDFKVITEYQTGMMLDGRFPVLYAGDYCSNNPSLLFISEDEISTRNKKTGYYLSYEYFYDKNNSLSKKSDLGKIYHDLFDGKRSVIENNSSNSSRVLPHHFYVRSGNLANFSDTSPNGNNDPDLLEIGLMRSLQVMHKECGSLPEKINLMAAMKVTDKTRKVNGRYPTLVKVYFRGSMNPLDGSLGIVPDPEYRKASEFFSGIYAKAETNKEAYWANLYDSRKEKNKTSYNTGEWVVGAAIVFAFLALGGEAIDELCAKDPACP